MYEIHNVGLVGGDCFLIDDGVNAVMLDSGFAYCADVMIANVRRVLGDRPLDAVLLTHSHYDHASGSVYCRDVWPQLRVYAHPIAQRTFTRPGALRTMRELNENAAMLAGVTEPWNDKTDRLHVDVAVCEGDVVEIGNMRFQVLEVPGHTRDSIAFYWAEEKLLLSAETLGAPADDDVVMPCGLVGYAMTAQAIERAAALDVESLLTPHMGLIRGRQRVKHFFERSLYWLHEEKRRVCEGYEAGMSREELVEQRKSMFFVADIGRSQPEKAFLLNAGITVNMLLRECLGVEAE